MCSSVVFLCCCTNESYFDECHSIAQSDKATPKDADVVSERLRLALNSRDGSQADTEFPPTRRSGCYIEESFPLFPRCSVSEHSELPGIIRPRSTANRLRQTQGLPRSRKMAALRNSPLHDRRREVNWEQTKQRSTDLIAARVAEMRAPSDSVSRTN